MAGTVSSPLRADIVQPSKLGAAELDRWHELQRQSAPLQRAFLSPTFAQACERAGARAYVAVLHQDGCIRGFFPFQFQSAWHQCLRLGERIGGAMSDAAGIIAEPELRITTTSLLRVAGLSSLIMSHLASGQARFGLAADWSRVGHVTELGDGPDAYFTALLQRDRLLVRDTERRMRKAESSHGALRFTMTDHVTADLISDLIRQKRQQYNRTQVADVFADEANVRLLHTMSEMRAPDCRLVMSRLESGGRVLAQHLGPQYYDVLSHWFPVYNPEARHVSPGRLLLWHMIQTATEAGIGLIDFGEGDALYKREFATSSTRYGRAYWSVGGARATIGRIVQGMQWRLQARRHGSQPQAATQS